MWVIVALVLVTLVTYSSVGDFDFVNFDDPQYVYNNSEVAAGLTREGIAWAFRTGHASNWHPLTWLSLMLDVEWFGVNPAAHHRINLLFHLVNTLLLFGILFRATHAAGRSALVAALFAVHPLHVESVAWIAERKDVLSAFFFLLVLWTYTTYARRPTINRYLLVLVLLALGLQSKPMLVTTPFVLLLLDAWPLQRIGPKQWDRSLAQRLGAEKIPLLVLVLLSGVVTLLVQRQGGTMSALDTIPLEARLVNAVSSYVHYGFKLIWPVNLAVVYPYPGDLPPWKTGLSALSLLAVSAIAVAAFRRFPYVAVGWFWYLGMLVPVIGVVQVGSQAMADRYTYLPSVGLLIMLSWGAHDLLGRWTASHLARLLPAFLLVATLAWASWHQNQYWKNSVTLWTRTLAVAPHPRSEYAKPALALIHNGLADALVTQRRFQEAVPHFSRALELRPDAPVTHHALGSVLDELGRVDEAIAHYQQALVQDGALAASRNNLAAAYAKLGKIDEALAEMKIAISLQPNNVDYHYNYAVLLSQVGSFELARRHLEIALIHDPKFSEAREALSALRQAGTEP